MSNKTEMNTTRVTAAELDEIERLDREASPGPWTGFRATEDGDVLLDRIIDGQPMVCEFTDADVQLATRARTLLPRLAAEHRALHAAIAAVTGRGGTTAQLVHDLAATTRATASAAERALETNERQARELEAARVTGVQGEAAMRENEDLLTAIERAEHLSPLRKLAAKYRAMGRR